MPSRRRPGPEVVPRRATKPLGPGLSRDDKRKTERAARVKKRSEPISRILCRRSPLFRTSRIQTVIPLGRASRHGSSRLPARSPSRVDACLFDVAPRRDCPFHPGLQNSCFRNDLFFQTRLCCSDPRLTAGRRYLLRCSMESGLSSPRIRRAATVWLASRRHSMCSHRSSRTVVLIIQRHGVPAFAGTANGWGRRG